MEKTLFAGLTKLDEDESILDDSGAFIGRDRTIIDRLLELGAKTHRHTGLDGLGNPVQPLAASAIASGGTLPGDVSFSVGYTNEDADRGETLISPVITLSTPPQIERPLAAPDGVADYSAGSLPADTYYYAISWVDAEGGETPVGPALTIERSHGYPNGRVNLSGLTNGMVAAGASGWRLYRAIGGGDFMYLATGTGDTYTDDGSVSVQPDQQPLADGVNSTNSDNTLLLRLPSADAINDDASYINVYMSEDGTFSGNVFLAQFPVASAGQEVLYRSLTLYGQQPPDTNNSVGTAAQIDPDQDLLDWHWKRPVAAPYALGSGEQGDVRMVLSNGQLYAMIAPSGSGATQWTQLPSGGAAAAITVADEDGPNISPVSQLEFVASGDAEVGVTNVGGGLARVTIFAAGGGGGGGGMGASALLDVTDEDGPNIPDIGHLKFVGSGGTGVSTSDLGSGSAQVLIGAPSGYIPEAIFNAKGDLLVGIGPDDAEILPVGTDGKIPRASASQSKGILWTPDDGTPGPMPVDFVCPYDPMLVQNSVAVAGANQARASMIVIPKTGNLRDLYVYVGTSSGNVEGAVYSSEATRSKLWSGGSIACPGASAWGFLGDPNLAVEAGDILYFVIAADNTTATFGRANHLGASGLNQFPANFWAGDGHTPKRSCTIASFTPGSAPATISEANMVLTTFECCLIARIT